MTFTLTYRRLFRRMFLNIIWTVLIENKLGDRRNNRFILCETYWIEWYFFKQCVFFRGVVENAPTLAKWNTEFQIFQIGISTVLVSNYPCWISRSMVTNEGNIFTHCNWLIVEVQPWVCSLPNHQFLVTKYCTRTCGAYIRACAETECLSIKTE